MEKILENGPLLFVCAICILFFVICIVYTVWRFLSRVFGSDKTNSSKGIQETEEISGEQSLLEQHYNEIGQLKPTENDNGVGKIQSPFVAQRSEGKALKFDGLQNTSRHYPEPE